MYQLSRGSQLLLSVKHRYGIPKAYLRTATKAEALSLHKNIAHEDKPSKTEGKAPNFEDFEEAYKSKDTRQLLRAYGIFTLCSINLFVENQSKLLTWARRLLGQRVFSKMLKMTIYGQFLAGDTNEEVLHNAKCLRRHGVAAMFAYTPNESHGLGGRSLSESEESLLFDLNYKELLNCVEMASNSRGKEAEYPKLSFKLTCLTSPATLRALGEMITKTNEVLHSVVTDNSDRELVAKVNDTLSVVPSTASSLGLPKPRLPCSKDNIDSYTSSMATGLTMVRDQELNDMLKDRGYIEKALITPKEEVEFLKVWHRLVAISKKTSDLGVTFLMDAEQSYVQDAIDNITLDLKRIFNGKRPVLHNTYQCYLKRTYDRILRDLALADKEGFAFGAKIVRGAYMDEERKLAKEYGYPDIINDNYEATTAMYHKVATHLLERAKVAPPNAMQMTFATHNVETIQFIIEKLAALTIEPDPNLIGFAQLYGMKDFIAFPLGNAGYPAAKLLHYGPIEQSVTYLSRRLRENRAGLATAGHERHLVFKEIKRRIINR